MIYKLKYIIHILSFLFIISIIESCSNNDHYIISNFVTYECENFFPGNELKVIYEIQDSSLNIINDNFRIIATILDRNEYLFYHKEVKSKVINSKLIGIFKIPYNSVFIKINIFYREKEIPNVNLYLPVNNDNNRPELGSLTFLMKHSNNIEEFFQFYFKDKYYFPNCIYREKIYVELMLYNKISLNEINNHLDTINENFKLNSQSIDYDNKCIYYSTMAYIYRILNDTTEMNLNLLNFYKLIRLNQNKELNWLVQRNIIDIFQTFVINDKSLKISCNSNNFNTIYGIFDVLLKYPKISLFNKILRNLDSNFIITNLSKIEPVLSLCYDKTMKMMLKEENDFKIVDSNSDFFFHISNIFSFCQDYQKSIDILKKGLELFDNFENINNENDINYVSIKFDNGIYETMLLQISQNYLQLNDTTNAEKYLKKLLNVKMNMYTRGPIIFASEYLTKIAISRGNFDTSKKYINYSYLLSSPRLNMLVSIFKRKFGFKYSSLNIILGNVEKYKNYLELSKNPINPIYTDKGILNLNEIKNKFIILIAINDDCLACNFNLEDFINDVIKNYSMKTVLILFSKRNFKEIQNFNEIYFSYDVEILNKYNNENYLPFIMIINNGLIYYKLHSVPKKFQEILSSNVNK